MNPSIDRRLLLGSAVLLAGCATMRGGDAAHRQFVRRDGMRLMTGDRRYRFVGANMWYAA